MTNEELWMNLRQGCGSHSCVIKKPKGQGVNGRCQCRQRFTDMLADERRRVGEELLAVWPIGLSDLRRICGLEGGDERRNPYVIL